MASYQAKCVSILFALDGIINKIRFIADFAFVNHSFTTKLAGKKILHIFVILLFFFFSICDEIATLKAQRVYAQTAVLKLAGGKKKKQVKNNIRLQRSHLRRTCGIYLLFSVQIPFRNLVKSMSLHIHSAKVPAKHGFFFSFSLTKSAIY